VNVVTAPRHANIDVMSMFVTIVSIVCLPHTLYLHYTPPYLPHAPCGDVDDVTPADTPPRLFCHAAARVVVILVDDNVS